MHNMDYMSKFNGYIKWTKIEQSSCWFTVRANDDLIWMTMVESCA